MRILHGTSPVYTPLYTCDSSARDDCSTRASIALMCVCLSRFVFVFFSLTLEHFILALVYVRTRAPENFVATYRCRNELHWRFFYSRVNYPIYVDNYCCVECNEVWLASATRVHSSAISLLLTTRARMCLCVCVLLGFFISIGLIDYPRVANISQCAPIYTSLIVESIFSPFLRVSSRLVRFIACFALRINCTQHPQSNHSMRQCIKQI